MELNRIKRIFFLKKNTTKLNICIIILFFTNVAVFLYINLLDFLNTFFPLVAPFSHDSNFIVNNVLPEPYEIPLYLGLIFVLTVILTMFYRFKFTDKIINFINGLPQVIKIVMIAFLVILFIDYVGQFPLKNEIFPFIISREPLYYFKNWFLYIVFIFCSFGGFILFRHLSSKKLSIKLSDACIYIVIIGLGFFLTFEPQFPVSGHDYSFFYGPIFEVASGKTIINQATSQYGFSMIVFFAYLYKLKLFSFITLPIFIWFLYAIEFFLIFYLIYKSSKSLIFGLLAFFSVITLYFFCSYYIPFFEPQITPLRWLPITLFIYLVYKRQEIKSWTMTLSLSVLALWVIDIGLYLFMIYFFMLFILFLSKHINLLALIKVIVRTLISLTLVFIMINSIQFILSGHLINPLPILNKVNQYARSGHGMLPLESRSYLWFIFLVFFASLNMFLLRIGKERKHYWILISSISSFISAIYYVGRSHPVNLFVVSPFFIVAFYAVLSIVVVNLSKKYRLLLYIGLLFLFICLPSFWRRQAMGELFFQRIQKIKNNPFQFELNSKLTLHKSGVRLINDMISDDEILILHPDETYLHYLLGRKNYFNVNPQVAVIDTQSLIAYIKDVNKKCPKRIVVDCRIAEKCQGSNTYFYIDDGRSGFVQLELIKKLNSYCGVTYKPIKCSGTICIEES